MSVRERHPSTRAIVAVLRTVPDLAAAEAFYRDALGFRTVEAAHRLGPDETGLLGAAGTVTRLTMGLGPQRLGFLGFDSGGRPYPVDSTASDLWFQHCAVVVSDIEAACRHVTAHPITPITGGGPQQLPANTGGVRAFKFRDPVGHPLELLWFPEHAGDPAWHTASADLFEGVDHTAIAVADAAASTAFYAGVLGLAVADRSRNRGGEQARLDAIRDDDVDVVALAPTHAPPHLELLGYRVGSRRRPCDTAPADASVSRTVALVDDLDDVVSAFSRDAAPGSALRRGRWDGREAATLRDPDGHTWICVAA